MARHFYFRKMSSTAPTSTSEANPYWTRSVGTAFTDSPRPTAVGSSLTVTGDNRRANGGDLSNQPTRVISGVPERTDGLMKAGAASGAGCRLLRQGEHCGVAGPSMTSSQTPPPPTHFQVSWGNKGVASEG